MVFKGKSILIGAFNLIDVIEVKIRGISIMHYRGNGILLEGGSGNRIVENKINSVLSNGMAVSSSHDNLIWKNEICNAGDGVLLINRSTSNRVIENSVKECLDDGYETFLEEDSNNVFISNTAMDNGAYGLHIYGNNNLLHNNIMIGNRLAGIHVNLGSNIIATSNIINESKFMGTRIIEHSNLFFGNNHVENNRYQGIAVLIRATNGIYYDNTVMHSTDIGMVLTNLSGSNLVYDNKLKCNILNNITDSGTNNILLNNTDEPCKPCELISEDCSSDCCNWEER